MRSLLLAALVVTWAVGTLGRGFWTPDEPREADIAWRMSWQTGKAVPLLAGEAFCEKPPLTYWIAGASMAVFGKAPWAARLPNLLYAVITALAVGYLGFRSGGRVAGWAAAAAISTLLLSYQVAIWLASDAPLLAAVALALLGVFVGFYPRTAGERFRGYTLMHVGMALGFLSKSAAGWMVPVSTLLTLIVWERRPRELLRWELYAGVPLQLAVIGAWILAVYAGPEGAAQLKVFFWNNLVGRFAAVDAPADLQYASAHRNSPGKYLIELPLYLWPWTLLVAAAVRSAWAARHDPGNDLRAVRFAAATFLPTLVILSLAATARNIYLAPALPGVALLLAWWVGRANEPRDPWDLRALQATAILMLIAAVTLSGVAALIAWDAGRALRTPVTYTVIAVAGIGVALGLALHALRRARVRSVGATGLSLALAYCALLTGPLSQIFGLVDDWQDLRSIGLAVKHDAEDRPLVLYAPDETTRAWVDLYVSTRIDRVSGPVAAASLAQLRGHLLDQPNARVVARLSRDNLGPIIGSLARSVKRRAPGQPRATETDEPEWATAVGLRVEKTYALPNGRVYALLSLARAPPPR